MTKKLKILSKIIYCDNSLEDPKILKEIYQYLFTNLIGWWIEEIKDLEFYLWKDILNWPNLSVFEKPEVLTAVFLFKQLDQWFIIKKGKVIFISLDEWKKKYDKKIKNQNISASRSYRSNVESS